jgi:hypothetical protein
MSPWEKHCFPRRSGESKSEAIVAGTEMDWRPDGPKLLGIRPAVYNNTHSDQNIICKRRGAVRLTLKFTVNFKVGSLYIYIMQTLTLPYHEQPLTHSYPTFNHHHTRVELESVVRLSTVWNEVPSISAGIVTTTGQKVRKQIWRPAQAFSFVIKHA